jgi:hypothetical protein
MVFALCNGDHFSAVLTSVSLDGELGTAERINAIRWK